MGIAFYEDFRGFATRDDVTLAVTGSPWSSTFPTSIYLQTTLGRSRARTGGYTRVHQGLTTHNPDPYEMSVSAEFEITTSAYSLSIGFSTDGFLATVPTTLTIGGAFYAAVENYSLLANHAVAKIYHVSPIGATGQAHNIQMVAESQPFSRAAGRYFFDFHAVLDADGYVTMSLAKDKSVIVSGTVHVDAINSGRQAKTLQLVNITTDTYFTNVIFYKPDEQTPFPIGAVDIINIPAVDAKLKVGPVDDSVASSVEVTSNAFVDFPVTTTLPADAEILAAKALVRYTAGGGNEPTFPEFAVAIPGIGQKTFKPFPEEVPVGAAPKNHFVDLTADNPTPEQLNGAIFRFRSIAQ